MEKYDIWKEAVEQLSAEILCLEHPSASVLSWPLEMFANPQWSYNHFKRLESIPGNYGLVKNNQAEKVIAKWIPEVRASHGSCPLELWEKFTYVTL